MTAQIVWSSTRQRVEDYQLRGFVMEMSGDTIAHAGIPISETAGQLWERLIERAERKCRKLAEDSWGTTHECSLLFGHDGLCEWGKPRRFHDALPESDRGLDAFGEVIW